MSGEIRTWLLLNTALVLLFVLALIAAWFVGGLLALVYTVIVVAGGVVIVPFLTYPYPQKRWGPTTRCNACGYDLRGLERRGSCPECGREYSLRADAIRTGTDRAS